MNLLVTGADGFVGRLLVARLTGGANLPIPFTKLVLLDKAFGNVPRECNDSRIEFIEGSIADADTIARAFVSLPDIVFHLASVPGGLAEREYALGRDVNLNGTQALLDACARLPQAPRFVFASSISVLGAPLPEPVDDTTEPRPNMSYGAQKWIGEILVDDCHRRGWIDGRSIRLPGIVARPPQPTGALSIFMSDVIRELAAGRPYACPVSGDATMWLMSGATIVDNLIHAALADIPPDVRKRSWTLPALHCSMHELVEAVGIHARRPVESLVSYRPNATLEASFGNYPPLETPAADALGFRHDGTLARLVARSLDPSHIDSLPADA
ncbi:NAD-dependent epimerase/dehydratase family protein [Paraburkholderia tropica]|uniref:NAD-dependent epimerase/dehydratase family protein n=1 Tax=Paraburkholderia tropica TaxID=92647 RepID=UPI002AB218BA|nr:NAD-dependent epimerase/dehydratase family protein [Paraburkholderia tropica]